MDKFLFTDTDVALKSESHYSNSKRTKKKDFYF